MPGTSVVHRESPRERESHLKGEKQGTTRCSHRNAVLIAENTSMGGDADVTRQHVSAATRFIPRRALIVVPISSRDPPLELRHELKT